MINVAALDPSSLTLWYDTTLLGPSPGYQIICTAMHEAIFGEPQALPDIINAENDADVRRRCAYLASSIWHEKRHFLDLVLTNYGAFRVRQFLSLYVNQYQLLNQMLSRGEIYLPITAYADQVDAEIAGLTDAPEEIALQARDVRAREEILAEDRERGVRTPDDESIEVGGHAQLEALANIFQIGATHSLLGADAMLDVNREIIVDDPRNTRYRWPIWFVKVFGLEIFKTKEGELGVNMAPITAVLLGALAMRCWGQQSDDPFKRPVWPSTRLLAFFEYFRNHKIALYQCTAGEAWEIVNGAAHKLFGRTIIEELRTDLQFEADFVESVFKIEQGPVDEVKSVCREFHELRVSLVNLLEGMPEGFLDPELFAHSLLPLLHPLPVQIFPNGVMGEPEQGWSRLLGFELNDQVHGYHAVIPKKWPLTNDAVAFRDLPAWIRVINDHAPLAKLMMKGRNHRTMFGPELMRIENVLAGCGIKPRFDPAFEFPSDRVMPAKYFYRIRCVEEMVCDLCRSSVKRPDGWILSPWVFRTSERGIRAFLAAYAEWGKTKLVQDWSIWMVCPTCFGMLREKALV